MSIESIKMTLMKRIQEWKEHTGLGQLIQLKNTITGETDPVDEFIERQWEKLNQKKSKTYQLYGVPYCILDNQQECSELHNFFQDLGAINICQTAPTSPESLPFYIALNTIYIEPNLKNYALKLTKSSSLEVATDAQVTIYAQTLNDLELLSSFLLTESRPLEVQPKIAIPEDATIFKDEIQEFKTVIARLKSRGCVTLHRNLHEFCKFVETLYIEMNRETDLELKRMIQKRVANDRVLLAKAGSLPSAELTEYIRTDVLKSYDSCNLSGFLIPNSFNIPTAELPALAFQVNGISYLLIGGTYHEVGLIQLIRSITQPFRKVLVANRGEIAVRIIRTLKKLEVKSVVVYTKSDQSHVEFADEAVLLPGSNVSDTYLNIDLIIETALQHEVDAIIPGYGFLAENPLFSQACEEAGIVFVGPSTDSIQQLGLKHSAREIAKKAKVPLTPGSGLLYSINDALETAERFKYPVMLKSTAGGGGIGLQKCGSRSELIQGYETVRRLGESHFQNDGIFLEKFIDNARHVEVQIFGDGKGNAVHLGERDCTLQRRNQKVIEETPAPNLPSGIRRKMYEAAVNLAKLMKYKNAGTVEFIYDPKMDEFYFLEVNTRLQVEHPITEMVTGFDLVEWMLFIAANMPPNFGHVPPNVGAAMEVRIYAENPVKGFTPSSGLLTEVTFPDDVRVDTWVKLGVIVTTDFDPLVAKVIVHGSNRREVLMKLQKALEETKIYGVTTNIDYLKSILKSSMFQTAAMTTKILDTFLYEPKAIEIIEPGSYTTVQDYPGRVGYWKIGVPPSGPMDNYAHRVANQIVGNASNAPAIEITLIGPTILFHSSAIIALTGGSCNATLGQKPMELWTPIIVIPGQKLTIKKLATGCRAYLAIRGGLDTPSFLGSRSTFALGNMGGYNGRVLKYGDVIYTANFQESEPAHIDKRIIPTYSNKWEVGVLYGPHGSPDFFETVTDLLSADWKVHYNSNRFGVRLVGPKPKWARVDGGEAGLHPSNTHDYAYALGAMNFTGDEAVILTCDGPSLGGFVCPITVAEAEMWKIGQLKPGDLIRFKVVGWEEAMKLKSYQNECIKTLSGAVKQTIDNQIAPITPILHTTETPDLITYRQAGDRYILIEYGDNVFDLQHTYRIYKIAQLISQIPEVVEISPGVRSLLVEYHEITQSELLKTIIDLESQIQKSDNWVVPSRVILLPMAFEDSETVAAVERYRETIRNEAPWLPNNVDFLTKVNGFDSRDKVRNILFNATYLVLGLGDVFLGAPCAVPLDPRHRMLGTKYNPSRSFTPNGCVGIGGMYMCIYCMDSPGGYQLVGRTVPIWNKLAARPWLLDIFDQIQFYPVSETELSRHVECVQSGKFEFQIRDTEFNYGEYKQWLDANSADIELHSQKQISPEIARSLQVDNVWEVTSENPESKDDFGENVTNVYCDVVGRFWKSLVSVGDSVENGDPLVVIEAMKAELVVTAPKSGKVLKIYGKNGDFIDSGDVVTILE